MPAFGASRARSGIALAALALAATGLAGCGSEDKQGRTATVSNAVPVEVVADEYSFDPSTLVVRTGTGKRPASVDLQLRNEGALAHNIKVLEGDREIGGTPTFEGGETRSGRVELKPGKYRMVCTVGNHEELGMKGTLEVSASKERK
jgi:plastocyanin